MFSIQGSKLKAWTVSIVLLVVGVLNLVPAIVYFDPSRTVALYGLELSGTDLSISMRHRGVLLGLLGLALIFAAFKRDAIVPALVVLMHGDRQVSTKTLARIVGVKSVEPATPDGASKWTGYLVGGTSPFGTRTAMPVYVEKTIFDLDKIYINGGKRGFLVEIEPSILLEVIKVEIVEVGIEA